jgi:NDP-sugar pyrophosphorylase family protein
MKAMIFAAGKGTRLGSITRSIPKALVDINGKSALQIAVEKCSSSGFDDIIINVHHFPEMVIEEAKKLGVQGYNIKISDERDLLLETGGGLYKARSFFDKSPFLVYNVDIISDLDLSTLYQEHTRRSGLATLATRHRKGNRFFLIDADGRLRGWRNVSTGEEILATDQANGLEQIAFCGIHIIDPLIFRYMQEGIYSMTTLYLELAAEHKIFTYTDDSGFWGDIGTPENLEYIRKYSGR